MIMACCLLHNFIGIYMPIEPEKFIPMSLPIKKHQHGDNISTVESCKEFLKKNYFS